jgi:transcription elongation GreA/GreB family factor
MTATADAAPGVVQVGSWVLVEYASGENSAFVVPEPEDREPRRQRGSRASTLGRAVLGRRVGDWVAVREWNGLTGVVVVDVR